MAAQRSFGLAALLRMLAVLVLLAYPFLIYLGLQTFQPRQMVLLLVLLAACRMIGGKTQDGMLPYWLGALVLAAVFTVVLNSNVGLLFYPVLMNIAMLMFFASSLLRPPTVIEKIARRHEGELTDEIVAYTRLVTIAWCVFFLLNAIISTYTVFAGTEVWALYNGFIAYVLMGVFFAIEYLIRQRVKKRLGHANG